MKDYVTIKIRISERRWLGRNRDFLGYCEQFPGLRDRHRNYQICLGREDRYGTLAHELAHLCMLLLADNEAHNDQFKKLERLLLTLKGAEKDVIRETLRDFE